MVERVPLIDRVDYNPYEDQHVLVAHTPDHFCMGVIHLGEGPDQPTLIVMFPNVMNSSDGGHELLVEEIPPAEEGEAYIESILTEWYTLHANYTGDDKRQKDLMTLEHEQFHATQEIYECVQREAIPIDVKTIVSYFFTLVRRGYEPEDRIQ